MTQKFELHPLCTLFPRLGGKEFDSLVGDIHDNGLREPITLHDGLILDGGNRYRACLAAGVEPRFKRFSGDNLVTFVLSANLHRRHMTPGQHAAIVAAAQDWASAQTAGKPKCAHVSTLADTTKTRAETSGASIATQRRADAVAKADPKLVRKVATGETSLSEAVKKVAPQLAPRPPKQPEKPTPAHDEGPTLSELVDELQRENESLQAIIKASEADDLKAEAIKWRRAYEHSKREQGVAMDNAAKCQNREKYAVSMVRRCGKAVGVKDPAHTDLKDIARAVEVFAREAGVPA